MDDRALTSLRWSGIAGIVATVAFTVGDALLLGNSATAAQFPHLSQHADNELVRRSVMFLASSPGRLAAGALAGVFATPLYLAGLWHIFLASRPGGPRWALPPFVLLGAGICIASFVHGSFFYLGEI